jgi:hypothetical protein
MDPLVVVYNLNVESIPVTPQETDTPLVVDANALLASSRVALQRFQMIARR